MVIKYSDRISGYVDEKTPVLKFFDGKGYLIMTIMMGGGISLRYFCGKKTACPAFPKTYGKSNE